MATDDKFSEAVYAFLEYDEAGVRAHDLAIRFEVAVSTVKHWANGSARPHPRLQKQVLAYIEDGS